MSTAPTGPGDEIRLSRSQTRRDYRVSLALLVAGVVLLAGYYVYTVLAIAHGGYTLSPADGFYLNVLAGTAFALLFVGAIFAWANRSILRQAARLP